MKLSTALFLAIAGPALAFVPSNPSLARTGTTTLHMATDECPLDRRNLLQILAASTLSAMAVAASNPTPAFAASYSQTYLSEPTEEFKQNEEKAMAFKREQLKLKGEVQSLLDKITKEDKTEEELVKDLQNLTKLIAYVGGLPSGIKKDDLVKQIRSKKAKGFWPTAVEYEYQAVIRELAYQQSPNTEKDMANPL